VTIRSRSGTSRLDLGDAIHDGWLAFSRRPWTFVAFTVLMTLALGLLWRLLLVTFPLEGALAGRDRWGGRALLLLEGIGLVVLWLWAGVGLTGGASAALEGRRPRLGRMVRWQGRTVARVARAMLLVALIPATAIAANLLLLGGALTLVNWLAEGSTGLAREALTLVSLALGLLMLALLGCTLLACLYLTVNQKFLFQIALLEGGGPARMLRRGRRLIDPHWPLMLLLAVIETVLLLLGLATCFVGVFLSWPLVACIATAAYRQLAAEVASADDPAG
jgi:hypothetical protein